MTGTILDSFIIHWGACLNKCWIFGTFVCVVGNGNNNTTFYVSACRSSLNMLAGLKSKENRHEPNLFARRIDRRTIEPVTWSRARQKFRIKQKPQFANCQLEWLNQIWPILFYKLNRINRERRSRSQLVVEQIVLVFRKIDIMDDCSILSFLW